MDRKEVLAPILHPLDGSTQAPGQVGHQEVLGVELAACAEPAAGISLREVDAALVEAQQGGERPPVEVGDFCRAPYGQELRRGVPLGQESASLHRRRGLPPEGESLSHDARRLPQRGLDVPERGRPRVRHVALGKERRRAVVLQVFGVDEGRQDVVLDLDELAGVDGARAIVRDDDRHRLADVPHPVANQWRLQIGSVPRLGALADGNRWNTAEIGPRHAGQDALLRQGSPRVHVDHAGVSVWAPHDHGVHHAWSGEVVHVPSTADEQAWIFEPLDRSADEFHASGRIIASRQGRPFERTRGENNGEPARYLIALPSRAMSSAGRRSALSRARSHRPRRRPAPSRGRGTNTGRLSTYPQLPTT